MTNISRLISTVVIIVWFGLVRPVSSRDYLEDAGNVLQVALPVAAFGVSAYKKDIKGMVQFAGAFAATEIITQGLKYTIKEKRPDGGDHSFPSGHSSAAFCGASYLDIRYGDPWGVPAYILAAVTGWSRIESDNHYPWDVAAGALVGVAGNLVFTRHHISKVRIVPVSGNGSMGAAVVYRW